MIYVFSFFFSVGRVRCAFAFVPDFPASRWHENKEIKARERASVDRLPTRWFSLVCACGEIALYQNVSN